MLAEWIAKFRRLAKDNPYFVPVCVGVLGFALYFVWKLLQGTLDSIDDWMGRGESFSPVRQMLVGTILSMVTMAFYYWAQRTAAGASSIRVEKNQDLNRYSDFAGLDDFKEEMKTFVERCFGMDPRAQRLKISQQGLLFFGDPGCGKTFFVRCLAGETGADLLHVRTSDMQSPYVGGISKAVAEVFDYCRSYTKGGKNKLILFLDEMEGVAASRTGGEQHAEGKKGVQTLLACIDAARKLPNFVLVGATNHPEGIDDAVKRDGRFDLRREFPRPDEQARTELIKHFLRERVEAVAGDFDLEALAGATSGRSAAEINAFLQRATTLALEEGGPLTNELLLRAVRQATPGKRPPQPPVQWDDYVGDPQIITLGKQLAADLMDPVKWGDAAKAPIGTVLLYSEPGMGKTYWLKAVATGAGASFYEINSSSIATKWMGDAETKVQAIFKEARDNRPSVVFMDEIDSIAGTRQAETGGNVAEVNNRIVNTLLTELEGAAKSNAQVLIIGATNRYDAIDAAIKRRFKKHVYLPPPSLENRRDLFKVACKGLSVAADFDPVFLAKSSNQFSNDDVVTAARTAAETAKKRGENKGSATVTQADLLAAITQVRYRGLEMPDPGRYNWDRVIIPRRTRDECELALKLLTDIEFLEKSGLTPPLGMILEGPPGTGKTELAKTIAAMSQCGFVEIKSQEILKESPGGTLSKIDALMNKAIKASPCVVFLDEIEALVPKRDEGTGQGMTMLIDGLLQIFNKAREKGRILVVGATNHYAKMDPAIVRPGRLEQRIHVGLPDSECREKLWKLYIGKTPNLAPELKVDELPGKLVNDSAGLSPAEIMGAVEAARRQALTEGMRTGGREPALIHLSDLLSNVQEQLGNRPGTLIMERPSKEKYSWHNVIIPEATLRECKLELALLTNPDKALAKGITPPLGVVFEGPPGTGKTVLAKTMAAEAGVNYFELGRDHLTRGHGDIEARVREVFDSILRALPAIVFLDECENMLSSREHMLADLTNAMLKALTHLCEVGSGRVLVIGATNFYERLDPAIVRSGRLERRITIGLPDAAGRAALWQLYLSKVPDGAWEPADPVPRHVAQLVSASEHRSPADIKATIEMAKMEALARELEGSGSAHVVLADVLGALEKTARSRG